MRRCALALFVALVGCGYDFGKFEQAPPADSTVGDAYDATNADSSPSDVAKDAPDGADGGDSGDVADSTIVVDSGTVQDTSAIGDVAAWPDSAGLCREFYDAAKKRTYVICSPEPTTTPFNLARTYCTTHGLDLAYVDDDETQTFLFTSLAAMPGGTGQKAWIGLKFAPDGGPDGAYWLNGEPMAYTHWTAGAPGDNGASWESNCGDMYGGDGEWRDYFCTYASFWFICGPP